MGGEYRKSKIMLAAAIAILFSGALAFADTGKGYGHCRGTHQGKGWHHRGHGFSGCGAADNLSAEEIKQLDESRTLFFEVTEDLRRKIYQKRLELASELAKENPDPTTAAAIQKEVSDFRAQIDQKRLEHRLRVRKINPDLGLRFCGGGHRGAECGRGQGWGWMHGGGYCMGPGGGKGYGRMHHGGYGMGPWCSRGQGMMHHGGYGIGTGCGNEQFMVHHRRYGMGAESGRGPGYGKGPNMRDPGGPGRNCPQQYDQEQGTRKTE